MIKIDANYTDYRDDTDENYPYGKAIGTTTPEGTDGTPWNEDFFNDLHGARQAIFKKAFGSEKEPSNSPDNISESDTLDAILELIQKAFSSRAFLVEASGVETVVSWSDLGLTYDESKTYSAIAAAHGNYEEFLPMGVEIDEDGIHIFPHRLVSGEIKNGTRATRWGEKKWGDGKWAEYGTMKVDLRIESV